MNQSRRVQRLSVLLVAVVVYCMGLGGCGESPTDSAPRADIDYVVYFYSMSGDRGMYKYYPLTQELDSADLHYEVTGYDHFKSLSVSADGELLYMPFESSVVVFDSDSLYPVAELPYKTRYPVEVSPDGSYIAVFGNGVWILNTTDYSVYYHDTTNAIMGVFSADGMRLYAHGSESQPPFTAYLYVLDLSGAVPVSEKRNSPGYPYRLLPTSDESKYLVVDGLGGFKIYDVASDSIVLSHHMVGEGGRIALTPDDRFAFYGSPATVLPPDPGTSAFAVIDVQNNLVDEVIDTRFVIDSITPDWFGVGSLAVTPDGRYLVMLDAPMANELLLFDIENRTFVDYIDFGRNVELTDMDLRVITE